MEAPTPSAAAARTEPGKGTGVLPDSAPYERSKTSLIFQALRHGVSLLSLAGCCLSEHGLQTGVLRPGIPPDHFQAVVKLESLIEPGLPADVAKLRVLELSLQTFLSMEEHYPDLLPNDDVMGREFTIFKENMAQLQAKGHARPEVYLGVCVVPLKLTWHVLTEHKAVLIEGDWQAKMEGATTVCGPVLSAILGGLREYGSAGLKVLAEGAAVERLSETAVQCTMNMVMLSWELAEGGLLLGCGDPAWRLPFEAICKDMQPTRYFLITRTLVFRLCVEHALWTEGRQLKLTAQHLHLLQSLASENVQTQAGLSRRVADVAQTITVQGAQIRDVYVQLSRAQEQADVRLLQSLAKQVDVRARLDLEHTNATQLAQLKRSFVILRQFYVDTAMMTRRSMRKEVLRIKQEMRKPGRGVELAAELRDAEEDVAKLDALVSRGNALAAEWKAAAGYSPAQKPRQFRSLKEKNASGI